LADCSTDRLKLGKRNVDREDTARQSLPDDLGVSSVTAAAGVRPCRPGQPHAGV